MGKDFLEKRSRIFLLILLNPFLCLNAVWICVFTVGAIGDFFSFDRFCFSFWSSFAFFSASQLDFCFDCLYLHSTLEFRAGASVPGWNQVPWLQVFRIFGLVSEFQAGTKFQASISENSYWPSSKDPRVPEFWTAIQSSDLIPSSKVPVVPSSRMLSRIQSWYQFPGVPDFQAGIWVPGW